MNKLMNTRTHVANITPPASVDRWKHNSNSCIYFTVSPNNI